jgi:hypothetical protein
VDVRFELHAEGAEVIIVHERIESEALRADHEQGWFGRLDNLVALLGWAAGLDTRMSHGALRGAVGKLPTAPRFEVRCGGASAPLMATNRTRCGSRA